MPIKTTKKRKPAKKRKDARLHLRLTEDQRKVLEVAADRAGLDLSSWVRSTLLKAAEEGKE